MTPVWGFPAYGLLITGPYAAVVLSITLSQRLAFNAIVAGFTLQGLGFLLSLMIYSAFIFRLQTQKLPSESARPAVFVSVGPCGFTVAGILGLAEKIPRALPPDGLMGDANLTASVFQIIATWSMHWVWGMALWFFF